MVKSDLREYAKKEEIKNSLLDLVYPIGSYYWSSKATNPSTFIGGTWEQIKDRFIYAKGDNTVVDSLGGNSSVTLTANNLPKHTHGGTISGGVYTFKGNSISGTIQADTIDDSSPSGVFTRQNVVLGNNITGSGNGGVYNFNFNAIPSGTISVKTNPTFTGTVNTTSNTAINTMPPYKVAYCWHRIA